MIASSLRESMSEGSQLSSIWININCCSIGTSKKDVVAEVKKRVDEGMIPTPSTMFLTKSVQLCYWLEDTVAITADVIQIYQLITEKLVESLFDLKATSSFCDSSCLMNVLKSTNSQSDDTVDIIQVGGYYSLIELHEIIIKPTEQQSPNLEFLVETSLYKLASARVSDLEVLWRYRGNQNRKTKGYRKDFTYIYSFHLSFFVENYFELQQRVEWLFNRAEISLDTDFEQTIKQAFNDCSQFLNWFEANNYVMKYAEDGIVRPHRSETIVKSLNISKREEVKLESIISEITKYERKKVREAERLLQKRRNGGIRSRESILYTKRRERIELRSKALGMLKNGMSKKTVAEMLNMSRPTLYKVLSEEE